MAYTLFDPTKPDPATQSGTAFGSSARTNDAALRDACIVGGGFFGFALAIGGPADQPTTMTYSKGTERLRATLTWGTIGGESGNVISSVFAYSSDSGGTYSAIGTKTTGYDANSYVISTTWS